MSSVSVCRCAVRADGWIREPIDIFGRCVSCRGQVYQTLAGRSAALAARLAEGERATQKWCCQDSGDCVCEAAA